MNKKQILQVSLAGIIGFVIYVAVSILSGEIERHLFCHLCYTSPACTLYKKV